MLEHCFSRVFLVSSRWTHGLGLESSWSLFLKCLTSHAAFLWFECSISYFFIDKTLEREDRKWASWLCRQENSRLTPTRSTSWDSWPCSHQIAIEDKTNELGHKPVKQINFFFWKKRKGGKSFRSNRRDRNDSLHPSTENKNLCSTQHTRVSFILLDNNNFRCRAVPCCCLHRSGSIFSGTPASTTISLLMLFSSKTQESLSLDLPFSPRVSEQHAGDRGNVTHK